MVWNGCISKYPVPTNNQLWFPGWWVPMEFAPVGPHLDGLLKSDEIKDIHFAQDLSGEEQPVFSGWFAPYGSCDGYYAVAPLAWRAKNGCLDM